jgi:hypothetical protein
VSFLNRAIHFIFHYWDLLGGTQKRTKNFRGERKREREREKEREREREKIPCINKSEKRLVGKNVSSLFH